MSTTAPGQGAGFDPFADGSTLLLSMESQLVSLYAERDQLQRELGVSDASDIISMVRSLQDEVAGLRARLAEGVAAPVPAPPEPTAGAPARSAAPEADHNELQAWRNLGESPDEVRRRLEGHERQMGSVVTLVDNLNSLLQSVPFEPIDLSGCDEAVIGPVRKLEKRVGSVINLVDSVNDLLKERR